MDIMRRRTLGGDDCMQVCEHKAIKLPRNKESRSLHESSIVEKVEGGMQ